MLELSGYYLLTIYIYSHAHFWSIGFSVVSTNLLCNSTESNNHLSNATVIQGKSFSVYQLVKAEATADLSNSVSVCLFECLCVVWGCNYSVLMTITYMYNCSGVCTWYLTTTYLIPFFSPTFWNKSKKRKEKQRCGSQYINSAIIVKDIYWSKNTHLCILSIDR